MADIEITIDHDLHLTTFTVIGSLKPGELLKSAQIATDNELTTLILCDLTNASWAGFTNHDFKTGVTEGRKYARKGDKNAYVFGSEVDYGLGRMVQAFTEIAEYDNDFRVFKKMDEAREWLLG